MFPDVVLGLSDHTPGLSTVLGAIALGARVVEKHFTDDTSRQGPDHGFSMDPTAWKDMVTAARQLELALGGADKRVEANEQETVVCSAAACEQPLTSSRVTSSTTRPSTC
jgi:N-acetylneuraminate synthase